MFKDLTSEYQNSQVVPIPILCELKTTQLIKVNCSSQESQLITNTNSKPFTLKAQRVPKRQTGD